MRVATRSSSSRSWLTKSTVLGDSTSRGLQPALGGHVEVVVGLVEHEHLVGAAQQRLEHDPLLLTARQRRHLAPLGPVEGRAQRGHGADVPEGLPLVAADVAPVGQRLGVVELVLLGLALHHRAARCGRPRGPRGAPGRAPPSTSRSRTVVSSRTLPMNWRITPRPPLRVTAPSDAVRSPARIRSRVVLPVPLGPIRATLAPSPTRKVTSRSSASPVGQGEAHGVDVEVAHEGPVSPTSAANSREIRGPGAGVSAASVFSSTKKRPNIPATRVDARRSRVVRPPPRPIAQPATQSRIVLQPAPRSPRCAPRHRARS